MPEGPECKLFATLLATKLKRIESFRIVSGRYAKSKPSGYDKFTTPIDVAEIRVKGKFLYFRLANDTFIWQTLGMTGCWLDEPDKHTRIIVNDSLFYSDQRNFGTLKFNMSPIETIRKIRNLGYDFLNESVCHEAAAKKIRTSRKTLAQILMDQKHLAGVGNYVKAEVLYRSHLSPHRVGNNLSVAESLRLVAETKNVLEESWQSKPGVLANYPECGASFKKVIYKKTRDPLGNRIIAEETKDKRTTYWVPNLQR